MQYYHWEYSGKNFPAENFRQTQGQDTQMFARHQISFLIFSLILPIILLQNICTLCETIIPRDCSAIFVAPDERIFKTMHTLHILNTLRPERHRFHPTTSTNTWIAKYLIKFSIIHKLWKELIKGNNGN